MGHITLMPWGELLLETMSAVCRGSIAHCTIRETLAFWSRNLALLRMPWRAEHRVGNNICTDSRDAMYHKNKTILVTLAAKRSVHSAAWKVDCILKAELLDHRYKTNGPDERSGMVSRVSLTTLSTSYLMCLPLLHRRPCDVETHPT